MLVLKNNNRILFLGSIRINSIDNLAANHVNLSHIASHDPTKQLLYIAAWCQKKQVSRLTF